MPYVMDGMSSVDIDNMLDFKFAEFWWRRILMFDENHVFIIAEAGVNHNGDINIAKNL